MIIERILFNIIAVTLFIVIFVKMIKKNDTTYIDILFLQFIGISISFIELIFGIKINIVFFILMYLLAIILPAVVIYVEAEKNILFPEMLNIAIAKFFIIKKDEATAKRYLLKFIDKYPNSYLGHKTLAEIYEKQKNFSNSIDEYVRAIEINTKDYNSYYKIAFFLNKLNRNDESIKMLNNLIKIKPEYTEASMLLADILFEKEQFKEAAIVYQDALQFSPGNYDIYYSLGMVYTMLNDFQRAKGYYETAAEINSLIYNGQFSLAQIAMIYGELEEAKRLFMECIKSENLESGSYYYLAQIAMIKGEKEIAINYINLAIELDSKIYKKIEGELIFAPIIKRIKPPILNDEREKRKEKLNSKEEKVKKHLEETYYLVNKLNNNDLKMMRNIKEFKKQEIRQKQKEKDDM